MFCRLVLSLLLPIVAGTTSAVLAKDQPRAVILQPSSKWFLDYGEGHCRLARQFGTDKRTTVFYLEQYEPGNRFTVAVAGPDIVPERIRSPKFRFGPGGAEASSDQLKAISMDGYGHGFWATGMGLLPNANPSPATSTPVGSTSYTPGPIPVALAPEDATHIEYFEVLESNRLIVRLDLGAMSEPIKAMNTCTDELLTHWGIDVAEYRKRLRGPEPKTSPATWISNADYPPGLARKGIEGPVFFRLDVDKTGKPIGCHIQQSTEPKGFEEIICGQMMRNAQFEPAELARVAG
jgi:TonB family protein